jgi:hypothetical protein
LAEIDRFCWSTWAIPWPDTYGLIDGLVGFGVYALGRLSPGLTPPGAAVACLERVIERWPRRPNTGPTASPG